MSKKWWLIALGVCLLLATFSPLASAYPDGLERVAEDQGFIARASPSPFVLIADYVFPGVNNAYLATVLAGWLGTLLLFALAYGFAWLIMRIKHKQVSS
jgi:ABC-type spermidine/putrescine transport system permease subunit I